MTAETSRGFDVPARPGRLQVDVCHGELGAVVFVRGDLDRASVPTLAAALWELLDTGAAGRSIVVNMASAPFVDVGGLNMFLDATQRAADQNVAFYLAGCSAHLVRLLRLLDAFHAVQVVGPQRGVVHRGVRLLR